MNEEEPDSLLISIVADILIFFIISGVFFGTLLLAGATFNMSEVRAILVIIGVLVILMHLAYEEGR